MPISINILNAIKDLKVDNEDKNLLVSILEIEDYGVKQYTKDYEETIKSYLKQKEVDKNE